LGSWGKTRTLCVDLAWQPFPHAYNSTNDQLHCTMSTGRLAFPSNLAYHLERTPKFLGGRQLAAMMVRPLLARQSQKHSSNSSFSSNRSSMATRQMRRGSAKIAQKMNTLEPNAQCHPI